MSQIDFENIDGDLTIEGYNGGVTITCQLKALMIGEHTI